MDNKDLLAWVDEQLYSLKDVMENSEKEGLGPPCAMIKEDYAALMKIRAILSDRSDNA